MKNKLLIALIITAIVSLALGAIPSSATTIYTSGYYTYISDGEAIITGVDDSISGDVIIPSTLGGYPVTQIGGGVFYNRTDLTSITIPDSVTQITGNVFYNCTGLTKVNITDIKTWCNIDFGVKYANPLYYAKNLYLNDKLITEFVVPDGVTSIKKYAFYNCTSLKSITFPDSVTTIGEKAFYGCEGLTNITFPDSVTDISYCAFCKCTGLTSVTIGDGVKNIGEFAFSDCSNLTKVSITSLEAWCNISFNNNSANPLYYAKNLYLNNALVTDLVIPDGITRINDYAFKNCSKLTRLTLADTVTSIGDWSFSGCTELSYIAFTDNITDIGESAFCGCSNLIDITIPDGVTTINDGTFYYCKGLRSVSVPNSVKSIGDAAFEGCSALTNITLGNNVQSIGMFAFCTCTSLTSITLPDSLTFIDGGAFRDCTNLKNVYFSGTEEEWGKITTKSDNSPLTDANIYYLSPRTETTVSSDSKTFSVKTVGVESGKMIILALYDGETLVDVQATPCTGTSALFTTTKTYTKARVFVWNALSDISPVFSPEIVK